jgi:hypothetical protein
MSSFLSAAAGCVSRHRTGVDPPLPWAATGGRRRQKKVPLPPEVGGGCKRPFVSRIRTRGSRRRARWSSVRSVLLDPPTSSPAQAWRRGARIPTAGGVDLASSRIHEQPVNPFLRFLDGLRRMFQLPWVDGETRLQAWTRLIRKTNERKKSNKKQNIYILLRIHSIIVCIRSVLMFSSFR